MSGLIAIEEAFQLPRLANEAKNHASGKDAERLARQLVDLHGERIDAMNEYGVDMMVLSATSPNAQGRSDPKEAAALAYESNEYAAQQCAKQPRFKAFCSLSMHDPVEAAAELERCVIAHGMVGAIVNDFQDMPDGSAMYYDSRDWDPFWQKVQALDTLVYIHPKFPHADVRRSMYTGRGQLLGACWSFSTTVGTHLLGLCTNGVFDRFPGVKVAVGHNGEHIIADMWRVSHWLAKNGEMKGMKMKRPLEYYFHHNIWITTSGNFNTKLLRLCVDEVGVDRVLFSIDWPYDQVSDAAKWWRTLDGQFTAEELRKMGRENAVSLLKL